MCIRDRTTAVASLTDTINQATSTLNDAIANGDQNTIDTLTPLITAAQTTADQVSSTLAAVRADNATQAELDEAIRLAGEARTALQDAINTLNATVNGSSEWVEVTTVTRGTGNANITVVDASGLSVGDLVRLRPTNCAGVSIIENLTIVSINGNNISFDRGVNFPCTRAAIDIYTTTGGLRGEVAALQTTLADLTTRVAALEDDTTNADEISAIQTTIMSLTASITALAPQTDVTDLQTRLALLESRVRTLQSELDYRYNQEYGSYLTNGLFFVDDLTATVTDTFELNIYADVPTEVADLVTVLHVIDINGNELAWNDDGVIVPPSIQGGNIYVGFTLDGRQHQETINLSSSLVTGSRERQGGRPRRPGN